jgi:TolB-like protein
MHYRPERLPFDVLAGNEIHRLNQSELVYSDDVWVIEALGVVLHEMIAGQIPFDGETPSHKIVQILDKEPRSLIDYAPDAPAELLRIVSKALSKDKRNRYQLIQQMLLDLRSVGEELGRTGRSSGSSRRPLARPPAEVTTRIVSETRDLGRVRDTPVSQAVPSTLDYPKQTRTRSGSAVTRSRRLRILVIAACIAMSALVAAVLWRQNRALHSGPRNVAVSRKPSIAVLPFRPISAESRDETLQMGIADTLIRRLNSISGIRVLPFSAVSRYADGQKSAIEAGHELNAQFVLDGRIQQHGGRVIVRGRRSGHARRKHDRFVPPGRRTDHRPSQGRR